MLKTAIILTSGLLLFASVKSSSQRLIELEKLDFGIKGAQFSPTLVDDGLIFCSRVDGSETLTDMYHVKRMKNGYSEPILFSDQLKSKYHDGPATLSADGSTLYYSRNYEANINSNDKTQTLRIGIFVSYKIDGVWSKPQEFELNDPKYTLSHPALSADGNRLYFSSDMPGGVGGFDIWYSEKDESGKWGEPVNLGPKVNSGRSEVFPYAHSSGRIYFSSNGGAGIGGMDIFYAEPMDSGWSYPILVPEPINSDADDFGIVLSEDLMSGYVSSSRKRNDLIYHFRMSYPENDKPCDTISSSSLCATFYEAGPEEGDDSELFEFMWDFGDGNSKKGAEVTHCYSKPGTYHVTLTVIDSIERNKEEVVAEYEYNIPEIQTIHIDCGMNCAPGKPVDLSAKRSSISELRIDEFFWDFGDGQRQAGQNVSHVYSKPGTYPVKVIGTQVESPKSKYESTCVVRMVEVK